MQSCGSAGPCVRCHSEGEQPDVDGLDKEPAQLHLIVATSEAGDHAAVIRGDHVVGPVEHLAWVSPL